MIGARTEGESEERRNAGYEKKGRRSAQVAEYLAGYGVRATRVIFNFTLEANEGTDKDEGGRNKAPKRYECNERAKRHGTAALTRPQHRVDDEEHKEKDARYSEGNSHRNLKLCTLFELLA